MHIPFRLIPRLNNYFSRYGRSWSNVRVREITVSLVALVAVVWMFVMLTEVNRQESDNGNRACKMVPTVSFADRKWQVLYTCNDFPFRFLIFKLPIYTDSNLLFLTPCWIHLSILSTFLLLTPSFLVFPLSLYVRTCTWTDRQRSQYRHPNRYTTDRTESPTLINT
jgi:uncharacterized membrane protein